MKENKSRKINAGTRGKGKSASAAETVKKEKAVGIRNSKQKSKNMKTKEGLRKEGPDGKISWKAGNMLYPLPSVMVSCKRDGEKPNIITIAWAGTVCSDPAMVSISVRPTRHSYNIIKESGEFVINLVNTELAEDCDWCGVRSGRDFDKFAERKLTPYVSEYMKTPAIKESPVNIYCKVKQELALGTHSMFVAEVVGVTVDGKYMDTKNRFDLGAAGLIAYSHGIYYTLGKKIGSFGYSVKNKRG